MLGPASWLSQAPRRRSEHDCAAVARRSGSVARALVVARRAGAGDGHERVAGEREADEQSDDEDEQVVYEKLLAGEDEWWPVRRGRGVTATDRGSRLARFRRRRSGVWVG